MTYWQPARALALASLAALRFMPAPADAQATVAAYHSRADSLRLAGNAAMDKRGVPEAMKLWRESLRLATTSRDSAAIGRAWLSIGGGFYRLGTLDSAMAYLVKAERVSRRYADTRARANAIGVLASVHRDLGELSVAESLYHRASRLREVIGDSRGIAADQNNLGALAQERGDFAEAAASYQRALALNRRDKRLSSVAINLSNLAAIATSIGNYQSAEQQYRESLRIAEKIDATADLPFILHGLGKLYISRGDYREAEKVLTRSARICDSTGAVNEGIDVRVDLSAVRRAMGQPEAALRLLREADLAARSAAIPVSTRAQIALSQGDVALEFGSMADADSHYSDAVNLYRSAADTVGFANALEAKASLLHSRGDDRAALKAASNASEIRRRYNDQRAASLSDLLVGGIQMSSGDVKGARVTLSRARSNFRRLGDAAGECAALAEMGDLWRKIGNLDSATTAYRSGLSRLGNRQAADVRWRLHAGLGEALRAKGLKPDAGREFRAAIAISESTAASIHLDERRSGFMSDKWEVYGALALLELDRGRIGDAFDVSERMRARQMLELLARGRVSATPEAREEQDLRRRIATLTARLAASTATSASVRESPMDLHARTLTRDELDKAQKQYAANLLRLRDSDPAYASAVSAKTRSWKEIASRLQRDQALLEYLITDSATWVFVLTSDTVAAVDLKIRGDDISNLVDLARRAIEAPANPDRPPLWPIPLRRLYSVLIRPVEDARYLRGKRTLLIAPHGELHFLSFASLVGPPPDSRFLVDRFDILYAPSATIWSELGRRRRTQLPPGILAMAPHAQRLPGTRREVEAIRRIYGTGAHVSTENAATSAALRSGIAQASVVHLATFGVLNKHNPLFSFIELAPTRDEDGHLDVNEVFGLRMSGQLVILSACQTALGSGAIGDVPPGDDWVGLVQAFLQAGASSVVASLWPVDDRATSDLMTVMHRNLRSGASPARALADAQRQLRRQQRTSHPFYWAAFTASGG